MISVAWFVAVHSRQTGDLVQAMVVGSLGISSEIGTTKLLAMFFYRHKVRKLVDLYLACDSLVTPGSRFANNLMKKLKEVKKRAILFWMVIIGNGVVYVVKPLLLPGRHLMEDFFIIYGLEPKFETPYYEISFLLMTAGVIFTCYLPANVSAFLIIITGYSEAQMTALSDELRHLWSDAQQNYKKTSNSAIDLSGSSHGSTLRNRVDDKLINEYIKQRLHEIIKIHTTNINLVLRVESMYRGSIAAEFLLLTLGIIVELLGRLENTYIQIPFALMQVGMDCFSGQRLIDASVAFEQAVYACHWEKLNVSNMKTILLMLQMSQKTMRLSAGGVTTLSFHSLAAVIRIIYSGYTALRQVTM
uniref:Odorant receptor n=1 Tax=Glyphodes pyloalis TaxID=1242752 RepID=A0A6M3GU47_GLYPY|nr:olfactory receptor [Glyphodes pyloalis]